MQDKLKTEWTALVQEGVRGQATRFRLRAARLVQLLHKTDAELAQVLMNGLAGAPASEAAREISPSFTAEAGEISPQLLQLEAMVQLPHPPIWVKSVDTSLQSIVEEWRATDALKSEGLVPVRTALLHGPPGVGKSLAAKWLAQAMDLPLATLNLAGVINSLLGRTGQNLAQVLDYARHQPCVLFLDEFDALAKRRDDGQDIGELKRVVNVLLQAIDQWEAPSLLLAATNHPELLDRAMFRRFDQVIEFPAVSVAQAKQALLGCSVKSTLANRLARDMAGKPLSEIYRRVAVARKLTIMRDEPFEEALVRIWALERPAKSKKQQRHAEVVVLHDRGITTREIGRRLGVSHSTVVRDLRSMGRDTHD